MPLRVTFFCTKAGLGELTFGRAFFPARLEPSVFLTAPFLAPAFFVPAKLGWGLSVAAFEVAAGTGAAASAPGGMLAGAGADNSAAGSAPAERDASELSSGASGADWAGLPTSALGADSSAGP